MRHHERQFEITSVVPLRAFCSFCYQRFEGMPSRYESADDVILRMRAEFNKHECKKPVRGIAVEQEKCEG